jgi:hypothetical protein
MKNEQVHISSALHYSHRSVKTSPVIISNTRPGRVCSMYNTWKSLYCATERKEGENELQNQNNINFLTKPDFHFNTTCSAEMTDIRPSRKTKYFGYTVQIQFNIYSTH